MCGLYTDVIGISYHVSLNDCMAFKLCGTERTLHLEVLCQLLTRGIEENHRDFSQDNRDSNRATPECKSALPLESTASHENSRSE
jgi:hypothetical protein